MKHIANYSLTLLIVISLAACAAPIPTPTLTLPTPTFTSVPPAITLTAIPKPTPSMKCVQAVEAPKLDIFAANLRLRRTVNLGEALESSGEGNAYLLDHQEIFYMVKASGFTAVRVPINFADHSTSSAPYTIQSSFWNDVDSVVDKAISCGLVVIINMQNFGVDEDPQVPYSQEDYFAALWSQISEHYKDYPNNILYFEPYNEPGDPVYWNALFRKAIQVIRKDNQSRPIIIDAPNWADFNGLSNLELPDDPNLIASFHYYNPLQFTHQGASFIKGASAWLGTTWNGTPDQIATINQNFDQVSTWAKNRKNPIPIFMGEFGSLSNADQDSRVRWTIAVRQAAESRNFSWGYWDLCKLQSPTFGIFNCQGLYNITYGVFTGDTNIIHALIPIPQK